MAKELNVDIKKLFDDIVPAVIKKNILVYEFFQHVAKDSALLKDTKLDAKAAAALEEAIKFRIKEASVKIEGKLKLSSFAANGIDIIKEAIKRAIEVKKENVLIKYLGAGVYSINVKASDYKAAEKIMEGAVEKALSHVKENEGEGNFVRMGA
ncbi:hypothetical protein HYX01_00870 [Candidatus Woesearchaeota archaeon]|nr:hypothetical protein [Candidatus Woesearchaeota archaeon]